MDERRKQLLLRKKELLLQKKAAMESADVSPSIKDRLGAALLGAGQSIPITEEIGSAMGALASYPVLKAREAFVDDYNAPSVNELYESSLSKTRGQIKKAAEDLPLEYYGGMIAGSIGTGMAGAATKTGAAIGSSLRSGGLPMRIAKGVGAGSTSGGLYGFGAGEGGFNERLSKAGEGAVAGGVLGGAVPAAGALVRSVGSSTKNIARGAAARSGEALDETLSGIKSISNDAYKRMRDSGALINKDSSQKIVNQIASAVKQSGPLNKKIHGNTISVLEDLKRMSKKGEIGLEELDQYRQLFGDMAGDIGNKSNARTSAIAREAIDDALDSLDDTAFTTGSKDALDALKLGRREFSRARKFETISDIVKKSEGDALYVKRELTKLINNPKKMRGYSADERAALKEAAKLSGGEAVLKIAGKFGFDPSRLGSGVGAAFGSGAAGVTLGAGGAAIVPAAGTAAKYGLKLSTRGKTENLLKAIEGTAKTNLPAKISSVKTPVVGTTLTGAAGANIPPIIQGQSPTRITINPAMQGREGVPDVALPQKRSSVYDVAPETYRAQLQPQTDIMQRIAMAESGGNPNARAQTSSASGLFQFTDGTWRSMVSKYGKKYGVRVSDKMNPQAQTIMIKELLRENSDALSKTLKRQPTAGELYIAHFAGAEGARKLLRAKGTQVAAAVLPSAAKANRSIFYADGKPRTVDEVLTILERKVT